MLQPRLLGIEIEQSIAPYTSKSGTEFYDPAFATNKTLPVHRWVPWIAGYSSAFVKGVLDNYLVDRRGTVLDPFVGVGTTLIEAVLGGHDAVGFEINPYAALASRTKAHAIQVDVGRFRREIERFTEYYNDQLALGLEPTSQPPSGFHSRTPFYSPDVLHKVLIVQDYIRTVYDPLLKDLFRLAFASTMVTYSNYSYEPSLGRRASAGKSDILDYSVGNEIDKKLYQMLEDIVWLTENVTCREAQVRIINDSFFEYTNHLAPDSIDLIITSPPYLNNYHYNRNTRPHMYWLGFAEKPKDFRPLEHQNFGTFWQTARDVERIDLTFDLAQSDIAERLQQLRETNPDKGIYGGNGWANYAAAYFNDCLRFANGMSYVLRPGSTALIVIGPSILQGIFIPVDEYLGQIAESVGLELVEIHVPRATRVGNSIIQSDVRVAKAKKSDQLYEAVVELRKH